MPHQSMMAFSHSSRSLSLTDLPSIHPNTTTYDPEQMSISPCAEMLKQTDIHRDTQKDVMRQTDRQTHRHTDTQWCFQAFTETLYNHSNRRLAVVQTALLASTSDSMTKLNTARKVVLHGADLKSNVEVTGCIMLRPDICPNKRLCELQTWQNY